MSARSLLLALTVGAVVATTGCSAVFPDSAPGPTLPPLPSSEIEVPSSTNGDTDVDTSVGVVTTDTAATTTSSTTSTTTSTTTTVLSTTTTSAATTTTTTTTSTTTSASAASALVSGVRATVGGRSLNFTAACLDDRNVTLDGVTWAFAGNSFRLVGDDDVRSAAELVGDGWTMPMVVASVRSGVYTYVGTPVDGSVSSAEVVVDHTGISSC